MNIFIKETDKVNVEVYVFETDNGISATSEQNEIPSGKKFETFVFMFRKPSYQDSNSILSKSQKKESDSFAISPSEFLNSILHSLLTDWDVKDEKGNKIPLTNKAINALSPDVARAAVAGCMKKITL